VVSNKLKTVILAAGEGSRMRPLTYTRPKVMLPIANKPILEYLLIEAKEAGVTDFIFVVGYHDEQVRNYFGDGNKWSVDIRYSYQSKQSGTADALRMVEGMIDGNFLMMNGDIILKSDDIKGLIEKNNNAIGVIEVKDPKGLGMIEIKNGNVVKIYEKIEKPPTNLANAGLYLFTPLIFEAISRTSKSPRGEYEITDSLQIIIDQGQTVSGYEISYWLDLSYPWHLLSAGESILPDVKVENHGKVESNTVINGPVSIGARTIIRSGSYIVGPAVIGEDCEIGPNCFIRPFTSIGNGCHVGAAVEIKNSIIMNRTKVPHLNYVGDSVIGEDCNLGAGTKIANLRFDGANINVSGIDTGRRKLGAIIGDRVKTGINASINTGSMIGNDVFIGPGAVVTGIVSPESRVF
jgi:UDP-N-acetylglucosamine diphosphorylase/glucosamine-1-phosphate N-acetyltransferase